MIQVRIPLAGSDISNIQYLGVGCFVTSPMGLCQRPPTPDEKPEGRPSGEPPSSPSLGSFDAANGRHQGERTPWVAAGEPGAP